MTNQISTQTISFYGSDLITLKLGDVIYTAVKPIVEAMGLDWGGQQQKLSKSSDKFNCRDISMVAKDGKIRQMLCMPLKKLNGWLFSINPEKVRPDLKERVIQYQEECFEALYNYWYFGKAERQQNLPLEPEKTFSFEFTEYELQELVWLWFGHRQMNELLGKLEKPLEAIGSRLHPMVYSYWQEYGRQNQNTEETMRRLLAPFKQSNRIGWQRMVQHLG